MTGPMTDQHCPLCTERYDERADLRVHLEVEHRKSEIVSQLIDSERRADAVADGSVTVERDRESRAPST